MARIRPLGQCEECPPQEGLKEIVSHGRCAKHNQQRLRAIWRKPEPSETQKQKLMEKLEKDLIAIKNMCTRWERDGYVSMNLITPGTIETFRAELDDYMDFRPTLKAAPPKTELEEALAGHKAPPPMFADEDAETAAKKSAPGQYQFAPVVEKPAAPTAAAALAPKPNVAKKSASMDKTLTDASGKKADEPGKGTKPDDTAKENVQPKDKTGPSETPGNLVENVRQPPLSSEKKAATGQRSGIEPEAHQEGTELKAGGQRMSR